MMVLLITETQDVSADYVCEWLVHLKVPFTRLNNQEADDLVSTVKISDSGAQISFGLKDGRTFFLDELEYIWFRRGNIRISLPDLSNSSLHNDHIKVVNDHLKSEAKTLLDFIYYNVRRIPSSNDPRNYTNNKLITLQLASELGLMIPETWVVKQANQLPTFKKIVTKNIQDVLSVHSHNIAFGHQTMLMPDEIDPEQSFGISLFQEYVNKRYEVRVFIFHSLVFSIAIFSQNNPQTQVDFRNYDRIKPNRMVRFNLPADLSGKLMLLLEKLDIRSGSVDLIYDGNDFIFLEVNPVGQFDFVSGYGNYLLEKQIAQCISDFTQTKNHG